MLSGEIALKNNHYYHYFSSLQVIEERIEVNIRNLNPDNLHQKIKHLKNAIGAMDNIYPNVMTELYDLQPNYPQNNLNISSKSYLFCYKYK